MPKKMETENQELEHLLELRTNQLQRAHTKLEQEIQEKQVTQQELQHSLRELADIKFALDEASIVAMTNQQGIITYVNEKFCEISKYSREELIGQDHRILNSGYHAKEYIRTLWTTIAQGRVWKGELRNRAKDGSLYWVDTTIVPFLNEKGKPYQYVAIRNDITALKQATEQLQRSMLENFASGLAHEIGNPLGAIRTTIQSIQEDFEEDPLWDVLDNVLGEIDRLNQIVRDFNALGRPGPSHFTNHVPQDILQGLLPLFSVEAKQKRIELRTHFEKTKEIYVDSQQVQQVLLNLVVNAFQVMPKGGTLEFTIREVPTEHQEYVEFVILDNGPGIAEEVQKHIFEPFFTTKVGGTGLGLSLAKTLVEQNQGFLHLKSEQKKGTIFTIGFPVNSSMRT